MNKQDDESLEQMLNGNDENRPCYDWREVNESIESAQEWNKAVDVYNDFKSKPKKEQRKILKDGVKYV